MRNPLALYHLLWKIFENGKFYPKLCFLRACFQVLYTRSRTHLGSLLSEYLRFFGDRVLDPFFFSPGASFEILNFLRCCHFRRKKIRRDFQLCIDVSSEHGAYFSNIASEIDFEETGECRQYSKMISWRNGKRRSKPLPKRAGETARKTGPISPVSGVKHACESVETSIFIL